MYDSSFGSIGLLVTACKVQESANGSSSQWFHYRRNFRSVRSATLDLRAYKKGQYKKLLLVGFKRNEVTAASTPHTYDVSGSQGSYIPGFFLEDPPIIPESIGASKVSHVGVYVTSVKGYT